MKGCLYISKHTRRGQRSSCWPTLAIFAVLISVINNGFAWIYDGPRNQAVIRGETVIMDCETNGTKRTFHVDNWKTQITSGNQSTSGLSYELLPTGSLLIKTTNTSVATDYVCVESLSSNIWSAQLVLLDSQPHCYRSPTNDNTLDVTFTCVVTGRGKWLPVMSFKKDGRAIKADGYYTRTTPDGKFALVGTVRHPASSTDKLKMEVKFNSSGKPPNTSATNVPVNVYSKTLSTTMPIVDDDGGGEAEKITSTGGWTGNTTNVVLITFVIILLLVVVVETFLLLRRRPRDRIKR